MLSDSEGGVNESLAMNHELIIAMIKTAVKQNKTNRECQQKLHGQRRTDENVHCRDDDDDDDDDEEEEGEEEEDFYSIYIALYHTVLY